MRDIRQSILEDRFLSLYEEKRAFLHASDLDNPTVPIKHKRRATPTPFSPPLA